MADDSVVDPGDGADGDGTGTGRTLARLVAVVGALEVAALVVFAGVEIASLDTDRPLVALTSGTFFMLYAGGLALCVRGLWLGRSWSRSPVLLSQLIALALAYNFWGGSTRWVSVVLAVPAVMAVGCLLHPATTEALYGTDDG